MVNKFFCVVCDWCDMESGFFDASENTPSNVKKDLIEDGWVYSKEGPEIKHYCPDCAAELRSPEYA